MVRVATAAKFPATLLAAADIGVFTNDEDLVLSAAATSGAATISVDDATAYAVGMWIAVRGINGLELVQVTAVQLNPPVLSVTRGKDGTTAIAHEAGERGVATIPAQALNQVRDELVAHATFLTPSGGAWTPGSVLFIGSTGNLAQDNAGLFWDDTNNALKVTSANSPVILATRTSTATNDYRNATRLLHKTTADMVDGFGAALSFAIQDSAGVENAIASVTAYRAGADNTGKLGFVVFAAGVEAERANLDSSGNFDIDAAFSIGATTVFEADRDLAITLLPNANNTLSLGSAARNFVALNARAVTSDSSLVLTPAAGSNLNLAVAGAGVVQVGGVSVFEADADLALSLLPNANNTLNLGSAARNFAVVNARAVTSDAGLTFTPAAGSNLNLAVAGAGGVQVAGTTVMESDRDVAITLLPNATATLDLGSAARVWNNAYIQNVNSGHILPLADNTYDLGSASLRWRDVYATGSSFRVIGAAGDANPTARLGSGLVALGVGGATATDVQWARQAVGVVELTSSGLAGSVRYGMLGAGLPTLALRAASADANALASLTSTGLSIGPGGATAVDVTVLRTGANTATITASAGLTITGDLYEAKVIGGTGVSSDLTLQTTSGVGDGTDNIVFKGGNNGATTLLTVTGTGQLQIPNATGTAGILFQGGEFQIYRSASREMTIWNVANGNVAYFREAGTFDLPLGPFQIGSVTLFEGDRDLAVALIPNADNTLDLGSAARRFNEAFATDYKVLAAASDANATARLNGSGVSFGAGGASAIDAFVERVVPTANKLIHVGAAAGGATGVWVDLTTPGVILKDAAGTPHYWRVTVDTAGALETTDIGTALP